MDAVGKARNELAKERDALEAQIAELSKRLSQVRKALAALDPEAPSTRKRRPTKPTATVEEYMGAVREVLADDPRPKRDVLLREVGRRIVALGRSRVALPVRVSQALRRLDIQLDRR